MVAVACPTLADLQVAALTETLMMRIGRESTLRDLCSPHGLEQSSDESGEKGDSVCGLWRGCAARASRRVAAG